MSNNIFKDLFDAVYMDKGEVKYPYPEDDDLVETLTGWAFGDSIVYELIVNTSEEVGEECYLIFKFRNKFYRVNYRYQSHYGIIYYGDGSEICEVFPKEVTRIEYSSTK